MLLSSGDGLIGNSNCFPPFYFWGARGEEEKISVTGAHLMGGEEEGEEEEEGEGAKMG